MSNDAMAQVCARSETASWCSGIDVRAVRLVSKIEDGNLEHNGPELMMCKSCRAVHGWRVALLQANTSASLLEGSSGQ
ncbi:hypothetical protein [Pseudomonas aeruginosa]|uniref:hypothetical protein n=1 Tax=Pseudomonas aeruginosa TaxID=287 RepID=UPI0013CDF4B9|nr:hypothetical protein [Pseudomonas aeruginosa]